MVFIPSPISLGNQILSTTAIEQAALQILIQKRLPVKRYEATDRNLGFREFRWDSFCWTFLATLHEFSKFARMAPFLGLSSVFWMVAAFALPKVFLYRLPADET